MNVPLPFEVERVWEAIQAMLKADIGNDVDVDCIAEEDFDVNGMLSLRLPAARVLFMDAKSEAIENQGLNYRDTMRFGVLCGDEYLGQDPQGQRLASLRLTKKVMHSLIGARLVLGNGLTSDPVLYTGMRPMAADVGMAYVAAFDVQGTSQYPGTHSTPSMPEEGENNG